MKKKIELDLDLVVDALEHHGGVVRRAARTLKVSKQLVYRFLKENPEAQAALDRIRGEAVEVGADSIFEIAQDPEHRDRFKASKLLVETFGEAQGWGKAQKHELTGAGGGAIRVAVGKLPTHEEVSAMSEDEAVAQFNKMLGLIGGDEDE